MSIVQIIPIPSNKIIEEEDDLISIILKSIEEHGYSLQNDDVLVIASKVVSVVEKRIRKYEDISPTKEAQVIGKRAHISPEFTQIILDEMPEEMLETAFDTASEVLEKIEKKEFEENRDSCYSYGKSCPYYRYCRTEGHDISGLVCMRNKK